MLWQSFSPIFGEDEKQHPKENAQLMEAKEKPLVAIALCTYNGEKYIEEQLLSILQQSYQSLEIIIVDDASTDQTYSILNRFKQQDSRIVLAQNESNIGFNANFRKALSLAKAEYIAIADQDDVWVADKIEQLMGAINNNLLIYHNSVYIDAQGKALGTSTQSHHRFVKGDCAINLVYYNCVSGHACLIHRSLLQVMDALPANFYYAWWLAYAASCTNKITYVDQCLVNHRLHQHSSTSQDKSDPSKSRIAHLNSLIAYQATPTSLSNLLQKLLAAYSNKKPGVFSFRLFLLLFQNSQALFYIRKKSLFSRLKFLIRESN